MKQEESDLAAESGQNELHNSSGDIIPAMMSKDQIDLLTLKRQQTGHSSSVQHHQLKTRAKQSMVVKQITSNPGQQQCTVGTLVATTSVKGSLVSSHERGDSNRLGHGHLSNMDLDQFQLGHADMSSGVHSKESTVKGSSKKGKAPLKVEKQTSIMSQELNQSLQQSQQLLALNNYDTELLNASPTYHLPQSLDEENAERDNYKQGRQKQKLTFYRRNVSTLLKGGTSDVDLKNLLAQEGTGAQALNQSSSPTFVMAKKTVDSAFTTEQALFNSMKDINGTSGDQNQITESSQLVKVSTPQNLVVHFLPKNSTSMDTDTINDVSDSVNPSICLQPPIAANNQKSIEPKKAPVQEQLTMKTVIIGSQKQLRSKRQMNKESVQFTIQPNQNHLVTPDHPMFLNQMQKLQQKNYSMSKRRASGVSESHSRKPAEPKSSKIQSQRSSIERQTDDTSTRELFKEKSMHQIEPNMIKEAAPIDSKRCTNQFQIKRELRSDSMDHSMQRLDKVKRVQKKSSLPFQFVNHNQDIHSRKKLIEKKNPLSITYDNSAGVKCIFQALPLKKQTLPASMSRLTSAQQRLQGKKLSLQKAERHSKHRNSQANLQREPSQEETLRIKKIEAPPSSMPHSSMDEKSQQKMLKNSLEILLRESNEDIFDHMTQLKNIEEMISAQSRTITIDSNSNINDTNRNNKILQLNQHKQIKNFRNVTDYGLVEPIKALVQSKFVVSSRDGHITPPIGQTDSYELQSDSVTPMCENVIKEDRSEQPDDPHSTVKKNEMTNKSTNRQITLFELNQKRAQMVPNLSMPFAADDESRETVEKQQQQLKIDETNQNPEDMLSSTQQMTSNFGATQKADKSDISQTELTSAKGQTLLQHLQRKAPHQAPPQVTISINKKGGHVSKQFHIPKSTMVISSENSARRLICHRKNNQSTLSLKSHHSRACTPQNQATSRQHSRADDNTSGMNKSSAIDLVNQYTEELVDQTYQNFPAEQDPQIDSEELAKKDMQVVMDLHEQHFYHNQMARRTRPMSQQLHRKGAKSVIRSSGTFHRRLQQMLNRDLEQSQRGSQPNLNNESQTSMSFFNANAGVTQGTTAQGTDDDQVATHHKVLSGHNLQSIFEDVYGSVRNSMINVRENMQAGLGNQRGSQAFISSNKPLLRPAPVNGERPTSMMHSSVEVLDHLKHDFQFKQVFRGFPKDRKVSANMTQYDFKMNHRGQFNFARPSEIQYELRKKQGDVIKQSIKVRTIHSKDVSQKAKSKQKSASYQMIMHVPVKRVVTTTGTNRGSQSSMMQIQQRRSRASRMDTGNLGSQRCIRTTGALNVASTANINIRDSNRQSLPGSILSIDIATDMKPQYSNNFLNNVNDIKPVSTEAFVSVETNIKEKKSSQGRRRSIGSQNSIKSSKVGSPQIFAGLHKLKSTQKMFKQKKAAIKTPDCQDKVVVRETVISKHSIDMSQTIPTKKSAYENINNKDVMTQPIVIPTQLNQNESKNLAGGGPSDYHSSKTATSNTIQHVALTDYLKLTKGNESEKSEGLLNRQNKVVATNVDADDFQHSDSVPDIRSASMMIMMEQQSETQEPQYLQMPRSFSIPPFQVSNLGDGTVNLDNSLKNFMKKSQTKASGQAGKVASKVPTSAKPLSGYLASKSLAQISNLSGVQKQHQSTHDPPQERHRHPHRPSMQCMDRKHSQKPNHNKAQRDRVSAGVNDSESAKLFLDQSMSQIHKNIPIQRNDLRPESRYSLMLSKHRERVLSQNARSQRKTKESQVSATPVSTNANLIRNRKCNNLSSYAHPRNIKGRHETVTESVEL